MKAMGGGENAVLKRIYQCLREILVELAIIRETMQYNERILNRILRDCRDKVERDYQEKA